MSGELRLAILGMDKSVSCLRYELPGSVWDDVFKKWDAGPQAGDGDTDRRG